MSDTIALLHLAAANTLEGIATAVKYSDLPLARLLESKVIYKGMDSEKYVQWTVIESSLPGTYSRPWQSSDASARTLTEEWQRSVRDRMRSQSFAERLPLP